MKRVLLAIGLFSLPAFALAAGLWQGFPIVGGASYCGSTVNGVCSQTIAAGPTTFTGIEVVPMDTQLAGGSQPQTVIAKITAFGQGANSIVTSPATATIPASTPLYFLNGTQASAFTITMPAVPNQNDIQIVACTAATAGVLTVAANTGQTLNGNPNAACVASVTYKWIFLGTVWFRV